MYMYVNALTAYAHELAVLLNAWVPNEAFLVCTYIYIVWHARSYFFATHTNPHSHTPGIRSTLNVILCFLVMPCFLAQVASLSILILCFLAEAASPSIRPSP